jgi:hypothetical protein
LSALPKVAEMPDEMWAHDVELPFEESLSSLRKVEQMTGVSERFRSDVRALALRMLSFQDRYRSFHLFAQLSQLGTGFGDGRQSDRDDHVGLHFTSGPGGDSVAVFLCGRRLTFAAKRGLGQVSKFETSYADQDELRAIVDSYCVRTWAGDI